jgi:uncharacterized membrane protein YcjF (UPF0283 family)
MLNRLRRRSAKTAQGRPAGLTTALIAAMLAVRPVPPI